MLTIKSLFGGVVLSLAIGAAQAAPVSVNFTSPQTIAGQNFNFAANALAPSNGGTATFTIHARGDYDSNTSTEFLTWDIDGLGIGGQAGPVLGGTTIAFENGNDTEWTQAFVIAAADLAAILADGTANFSLDLNGDQNAGVGIFGDAAFVEITFAYTSAVVTAVPEPGSLALLGLGLAGLAALRKRKQA